ncbi:MAG: endonuclease [Acholeplasma sp.]
MRKLFIVMVLMVSMFVLQACQDEPVVNIVTNEMLNQIEIGYDTDDDILGVTKDVTLVTSIAGIDGLDISWITSNQDYIEIDGNIGRVHQQSTDVDVTLTAKVKYFEDTKYVYFHLVVLKFTEVIDEDTIAPVITGTKDFELAFGADAPNWLADVLAVDDVDGAVDVTVDDSAVDLNKAGSYDLVYTATDSSNNSVTVTVTVVVLEAAVEVDTTKPVIIGTHDFEYTMGDPTPLYLEGVYATDDVDQTVVVSFDDSEVNLAQAGNYDLIYTAQDSAGNVQTVIVQVYVFDQAIGDDAVTYVETFENLSLTGSSYIDGSFTGINNIKWFYGGARGDQSLNGDAITFGGSADDQSFIRATIEDGIQSLSLKHKQPFGNTQDYGVFINSNLIGQFRAGTLNETFTHELDTPVTGEFTLEIKPLSPGGSRAQLTIDDLTWVSAPINQKPIEQQNAEFDKDTLNIQTSFIDDMIVDFKSKGIRGSDITWKFVDSENTANSYVNLNTGQITVPETGRVNVLVSATIKNGGFSYNKVFDLNIGEGDPISIESVRSLSNNDYAKTVGTITSIYHNATYSFIFIEDDSAAILIQAPKSLALSFNVGDMIEVKASKNVDQNFIILDQVRGLKKIGTHSVIPSLITADELSLNPAKLVTVSGLITKSYANTETNFEFVTLSGKFNILIPSDLDPAIKQAIQNKLANLDPGLEVTTTAPVIRMGNTHYLYITNSSEVEVADSVYFNDVADIIKDNLSIPNLSGFISEDINLTKSSELLFGAVISWVSSNESALSNLGVVYQSENDVNVTLTYTILYDGEVVKTHTFNLTIASLNSYDGYYASLSNKSGQALEDALRSLIRNTGHATGSTSQVKTVDNYNGQNYNIYTGFGSYGNREHVWPNSKLGSAPDYDLHNLRAAVVSVNSSRSNYPFTNQVKQTSYEKIGSTFYPGMEHVGDVARIVLYISVRYGLSLNLVGNLDMFLTWHEEDPVSDFELSRNGKIYNIQSNRNPFIDHPELVDVMFN